MSHPPLGSRRIPDLWLRRLVYHALRSHEPLDFKGAKVPEQVRLYIEEELGPGEVEKRSKWRLKPDG